MRRGFLLDKNDKRPKEPATIDKKTTEPVTNVKKTKEPVTNDKKTKGPATHSSQNAFAHPTYRYDTSGAPPQEDDEFKCTVMPPLPQSPYLKDSSGGGPYSLCVFHGRRQELAIRSTPGFPSPVPNPAQTRYRLGSLKNGGGMFASCHTNAGDLIVAERPLFMIPAIAIAAPVKMPPGFQASPAQLMQLQMRQYNMILEKCIERLPLEDKKAFYEFKTHNRKEGLGPILDRMEMNALSVVIESADSKEEFKNSAIFKHISRINHSCTPNATWDFDTASFSMQIRALRPLENNEEIFITYIDDETLTGRERQAVLQKYEITCACALCTKGV